MTDFIPGESYRIDITNSKDNTIVDSWSSTLRADLVGDDGNVIVDVSSGKVYAPVVGNIENTNGKVIFDVEDDKIYSTLQGDVRNVTGNIIVDADLNLFTGTLVGDINDEHGNLLVDVSQRLINVDTIESETITADNVYANLTGSISDNFGNVIFDADLQTITSDVKGDVINLAGEIIVDHELSKFIGNLQGNVIDEYGNTILSLKFKSLNLDTIDAESITVGNLIQGDLQGHVSDYSNNRILDIDTHEFKGTTIGDVKSVDGSIIVDADLNRFYGALEGDLLDSNGNVIVSSEYSHIEAKTFVGTFYGDLVGNIVGSSSLSGTFNGDFNGTSYGDFFGKSTGTHIGDVQGDTFGTHTGPVIGNFTGKLCAIDGTELTSEIDENFNQYNWLGGIAHPIDNPGDIAKGPIIVLGQERTQSALRAHVEHYDGSDVLTLTMTEDSPYKGSFNGQVFGDIFNRITGDSMLSSQDGITKINATTNVVIGAGSDTSDTNVQIIANNFYRRFTVRTTERANDYLVSRGTLYNPESVQPGDQLGSTGISAYENGEWKAAGGYGFFYDNTVPYNPSNPYVPTAFGISLSNGTNNPNITSQTRLEFKSNGSLSVPIFHARGTTFAERDGIVPEEGMIIFNKNSKKFQGFDGTNWVDLN